MKFSLLSLVLFVTVCCVFFAVISHGALAMLVIGGPLAGALWELIQLGRELQRR